MSTTWSCSRWAQGSAAPSSASGGLFRGGHGIAANSVTSASPATGCRAAAARTAASSSTHPAVRCSARRTRSRMPAASVRAGRVRAQKGTLTGPAISRSCWPGTPAPSRRSAGWRPRSARRARFQAVLDPELFVIGGGVAQLGEDLLGPVRIAYETSLPGYGDRPDRRVRDRRARQRRRVRRRDLATSAAATERIGDVLLADEVHRDRAAREGDLPPMDRRPPERPRRGAAILASNHLSLSTRSSFR